VHATTEQFVYRAHALDKIELVCRVLQARGRGATMIFTRTKRTAQKVADELAERGFKVGAVHGDLGQGAREKALKAFRTGKIDVLVATDVAARGIDIEDVTHVINYQCPEDEKVYVHRIGRTGRAGRAGVAVTLVDWDELPRWSTIDTALGLDCPDPAETYSSSPHLFTELDIPPDAGGSVGPKQPARRESGSSRRRDGDPTPRTTTRSRRRTRGGKSVTGHVETQPDSTPAETKTADSSAHAGRRRRRRPPRQSATTVG
jgi:superfamily II DNA/RNA helicase